jgi:hypothetical protein
MLELLVGVEHEEDAMTDQTGCIAKQRRESYDIDVASLGIQVMGVTEGFAKRIELMEPSEQAHRLSRQLILPQPL